MDPSNSQRLYLPTYRLYQTINGASSWTAISPDLTAGTYDTISTVAVAPSDPNTVYTGSNNGRVFVSRNATAGAGSTWTGVSSGLPTRSVTQVVAHPTNPQTAYVTLSGFAAYDHQGHIWVTTNAGGTWSNVTGNLPDVPTNDLVIDPDVAGTLYAATDIGVFRSLDSGASWLPLGTGLPYAVVNSLKLHRPTRTLRAATYGRGAWDILVTTGNQVNITVGASVAGAPFSLEDGTTYTAPVTFAWNIGATHTVTWLSTSDQVPGTRYAFQGWIDGSSANPRSLTVPSTNASYTANLTVQYLLTLAVSPAGAGTLTASPASSDGYYSSGSSLTLTASPATGYIFWYFVGISGTSPQTVTLSSPLSVTADFYCSLNLDYGMPYATGAGSVNGFVQWQTGNGCAWKLSSDSSWMTVGPPTSGTGSGIAPFAISQNNGLARNGTVTLATTIPGSSNTGESYPMAVPQGGSMAAQPSNVSASPNSGSGNAQTFTFQYYDPAGFAQISYAQVSVDNVPATNSCMIGYSGSNYLSLLVAGTWQYLALPSNNVVQNRNCILDGAHSSVSGSGNTLTLKLALTFKSAFQGFKDVTTYAYDSTGSLSSSTTLVGAWNVPGVCDVNNDGNANISDVQQIVNQALGTASAANDLNHDNAVNIADVQVVINGVLQLGCSGS